MKGIILALTLLALLSSMVGEDLTFGYEHLLISPQELLLMIDKAPSQNRYEVVRECEVPRQETLGYVLGLPTKTTSGRLLGLKVPVGIIPVQSDSTTGAYSVTSRFRWVSENEKVTVWTEGDNDPSLKYQVQRRYIERSSGNITWDDEQVTHRLYRLEGGNQDELELGFLTAQETIDDVTGAGYVLVRNDGDFGGYDDEGSGDFYWTDLQGGLVTPKGLFEQRPGYSVSRDGRIIVMQVDAGSRSTETDGFAVDQGGFYFIGDGQVVMKDYNYISCVTISPNSRFVAMATQHGAEQPRTFLYDGHGRVIRDYPFALIDEGRFSSDEGLLAFFFSISDQVLVDTQTGEPLLVVPELGYMVPADRSSGIVAMISNGVLLVIDYVNKKVLYRSPYGWPNPIGSIETLSISGDGRQLTIGTSSGKVQVLQMKEGS